MRRTAGLKHVGEGIRWGAWLWLGSLLACGWAGSAEVLVSTPTPSPVCGCSAGVNMSQEGDNVADPRNGASCGASPQYSSLSCLPSMLNDQNNSGQECAWASNPLWAPSNIIAFNKVVICNNIHLWFQGWPGWCSDPKKFKVEFYEWQPGQDPETEGAWTARVYVDNYAWYKDSQGNWHNVDQDLEFNFSPTGLTDKCRLTVYEAQNSNQPYQDWGMNPDKPGDWFAIGEMRVRGVTPTPTASPSPTPTETPIPPAELCMVDNTDPGFASTGTWVASTNSSQRYGADYLYHLSADGTDTAIWHFCSGSGLYEVFVWYPAAGNRATDAPFTVYTALGAAVVRVNQRVNGGRWVSLGKYTLGYGSYVDLSTKASSGYVVADAVRFVPTTETTTAVERPQWRGYR